MRNVILFDDDTWEHLLPLTYSRPTAEIRCGILTIREKWEKHLDAKTSYITQEYLADEFPIQIEDDNLVINGNVLPNPKLLRLINDLSPNEALMYQDDLIAARLSRTQFDHLVHNEQIDELNGYDLEETPVDRIQRPWEIFEKVGSEIEEDYRLLTKGRQSAARDKTSRWVGDQIFIEEGAQVEFSVIDSSSGPVYIGKNAKILANSVIKGPFVAGEDALVKVGAKIYGPTSIGKGSKVGGELKNVVMFNNSNKSHDGYLGNSVIGEYCNLGADTNTSNLRNDYGDVSLWSHANDEYESTGLQFCGLIMGDHSKSGINTMFNTGTVVGFSCNIYGGGFQPRFVPSFSWGGGNQFTEYRMDKSLEVADRVLKRKNKAITENMLNIFKQIQEITKTQRV